MNKEIKLVFEYECAEIPDKPIKMNENMAITTAKRIAFKSDFQSVLVAKMKEKGIKLEKEKNLIITASFFLKNMNREVETLINITLNAMQGILFEKRSQILDLHCGKTESLDDIEKIECYIWNY